MPPCPQCGAERGMGYTGSVRTCGVCGWCDLRQPIVARYEEFDRQPLLNDGPPSVYPHACPFVVDEETEEAHAGAFANAATTPSDGRGCHGNGAGGVPVVTKPHLPVPSSRTW